MTPSLVLAYLVFEVSSPPRWERFCWEVLGLPAPLANSDGSVGWQVDARAQRLIVRPGPADDVVALGFDCADDTALDALLVRLAAAGHRVEAGDAALRAARRVRRLHVVRDPDGNVVELCVRCRGRGAPVRVGCLPQRFRGRRSRPGPCGAGVRNAAALEAFYVEALGFGVTERLDTRIGPIQVQGVFMHCNRRHHSLALFDLPMRKRMHHFMLQAPDVRDIGMAYERARRLKVPMSLDLGQHPAPDSTVSFYGATPSGFDFEVGTGTQEIEPRTWQSRRMDQTSVWGHKPRLRPAMEDGHRPAAPAHEGAGRGCMRGRTHEPRRRTVAAPRGRGGARTGAARRRRAVVRPVAGRPQDAAQGRGRRAARRAAPAHRHGRPRARPLPLRLARAASTATAPTAGAAPSSTTRTACASPARTSVPAPAA